MGDLSLSVILTCVWREQLGNNNRFEYWWMDAQKKTSRVPAPQYIDFVMSWIQAQVHDENTFPTKDGKSKERKKERVFFMENPFLSSLALGLVTHHKTNSFLFNPTMLGREFPAKFQDVVRSIFKQLIRVFAHLYHSHYDKMLSLCQESHFNSLFAHFVSFGREFDLLDKKDIDPLQELIDIMDSNRILC
jgi:hypothetical protein